jgi:hypothetical protein
LKNLFRWFTRSSARSLAAISSGNGPRACSADTPPWFTNYLRLVDQEPSEAGRIEWDDDHDGRLPMLIIDGREVTWEDFGPMLMSFEGFHFELNIRDKSEEF